jgi:hypothetical protein
MRDGRAVAVHPAAVGGVLHGFPVADHGEVVAGDRVVPGNEVARVTPRARAVYRGYFHGGKQSALVRRLHVIRDTPVHANSYRFRPPPIGEQTWCGQSAGQHRNSQPVIVSPLPSRPPGGLTWCPSCIGHLAEHYGLLGEVAASVAAYDPEMTQ